MWRIPDFSELAFVDAFEYPFWTVKSTVLHIEINLPVALSYPIRTDDICWRHLRTSQKYVGFNVIFVDRNPLQLAPS
jgi:hypothetical protein